jgi:short-subunit dehydrogenase
MKSVVITGSTKGIGLGLAKEFLKKGCAVCLSGRNSEKLENEVKNLEAEFGSDKVTGLMCDVTDMDMVRALWDAAKKKYGIVDIWINNAGVTTTKKNILDLDASEIAPVINTNIIGLIYGCQVALRGMMEQGSGQIYNLEGFGSDDMKLPGMTVYGTSKRAVRYFTESLIDETEGLPVQIGTLSPGMVVTDFMLDGLKKIPEEKLIENKMIFNILADKVETVTPFLVEGMLNNNKSGARIAWLTEEKANERFNSDEYINRDLFSEFGF